jgi:UDP-sugar pyrophosphorylase
MHRWFTQHINPPVSCLSCLQDKVSQGGLLLAPRSVLLLDGPDIHIKNLRVDGALVVRAVPGARVVIDGLTVSNAGWSWTPTEEVGACHSVLLVASETAMAASWLASYEQL